MKFEELGIFKLKDKDGKRSIFIDFSEVKRPMTELKAMHIYKVAKQNNMLRILIEWKESN